MSATARTDIHRPSAPEFDPEKYELHGVYDLAPEWDAAAKIAERQAAVNALMARGYRFGGGRSGGCGHCGARFRYAALVAHPESREMMFIGETCLEGRFSMSRSEYLGAFRRVRDQAAAGRERLAHVARVAEFKTAHPEVTAVLSDSAILAESPNFLADIAAKLERYGNLSDRQIAAVVREGGRIRERLAHRRPQTRPTKATPAPEGRVTVTGTILFTKWQENRFGDGALKMRVLSDEGFTVWVTAPRSLGSAPLKGRRVEFAVTLKRADDDETHAWGSFPKSARLVD